MYMNRFNKSSRKFGSRVGKSLGKSAGVSGSKMTSILFLLITLFIALALSGVAFLVTRKPASMPVISEGMESKKEDDKKEGMKTDKPKEGMKTDKKEGASTMAKLHDMSGNPTPTATKATPPVAKM